MSGLNKSFNDTTPAAPSTDYVNGQWQKNTIGQASVYVPNKLSLENDVLISSPATGDLLTFDASTGLWKNKPQSSSFALNVKKKTANYTAVAGDLVLCDASGGPFTIALPSISTWTGEIIVIKKTDSSANVVTVAAHSGDTIDGVPSWTINFSGSSMTVASDGSVNGDIV